MLKQGFLHSGQEFPEIDKKKFILSIVLGLVGSFLIYSFLYLSREMLRLFSFTEGYSMWIFSDEEVNLLNLFFAFLSLIFAQSICFSYWFGSPRKAFEKRSVHQSVIISDQRILNISFLGWACLFVTLAYTNGCVFIAYSFYPKYNYLFIILLVVLFLHPWVTIRRIYKEKALKWMLISASIISILSFTYSRINLIDYQKINEINTSYKYKLDLAEVSMYIKPPIIPVRESIYLVNQLPDSDILNHPVLLFNGRELSFNDLEESLPHMSTIEYRYLYHLFFHQVYIDKSIKMSFVNRLKEILTNAGYSRIGYVIIPKDREYNSRMYLHFFFIQRLQRDEPYKDTDLTDFELLSISYANDSVQVNNIAYQKNDFYSVVMQKIEQHENYLFVFSVDEDMAFADYIFILDEIRRAIFTVRNAYAIKNYSMEYDDMLPSEALEIVISKIPMRLMEIYQP